MPSSQLGYHLEGIRGCQRAAGTIHLMVLRSTSDVVASAIGGWLAPDGRIWRCEDRHHEDTAEFLVRHLGLSIDRDAGDVLVDARWLRISHNGLVLGARYPTQAQLDVLFDLAHTHRTMRRRLMDELERARKRSVSAQEHAALTPTGR